MSRKECDPRLRTSLLAAAAALILETHDLDEVTLRRVAARAGVALGLANYHFGSRQELLRAAVRHALNEEIIKGYGTRDFAGESILDRVRAIILGPLEFMAAHPKLSRVSVLFDAEQPAVDDSSDRTFGEMERAIRSLVPPADLPADLAVRLWVVIGALHEAFLRPERALARMGLDMGEKSDRETLSGSLAAYLLGMA